ncbi:MAG: DUF4340 domain-containing protein [Nitrospira sp.]|nr:DUF4340 domain-containing protein [Nitrospira sp.]
MATSKPPLIIPMTAYRTTLLLAVIFAGLGVYVYTIEVPTMEHRTIQQAAAQRLLPFDYRDVTHLTYTTRTERIRMNRDERNRWRIVEPVEARGDAREIESVLRALEIGKISRDIQEEETEKGAVAEQYGLQAPYVTIDLRTPEYTESLALGNTGPLSSTLYARRGSDQNILLTTLMVEDFRAKTLETFRLKDILFFDRTRAERIQLQTPALTMTLQRGAGFHGPVPGWDFTSPVNAPADKTTVGILLMTLEDLSATGFIDSRAEKEALLKKLGTPSLTATVHTKQRGHHVAFFEPVASGEDAYAVTSSQDPMYRIPAHVLHGLPSKVFHLQDKRLFGMGSGEIALLTVRTNDWHYTLIQQHGEWYLEGKESEPIDQQQIKLFVSRLVDVPAELPVSETTNHPEQYGLKPATIEITGIDQKGRPLGHLALGTREKGLVYATGAGLSGIYQTRSLILSQIPAPETLLNQ